MKYFLERNVEFDSDQFDTLHSVWCGDTRVSFDRWVDEGKLGSVSLTWEEWDAMADEVARFRRLKSQSEAA